jgi:uncharacterized protein YbjT (DUF2867 family)
MDTRYKALITGTSGLIGSELLKIILDDEAFQEVVSWSRKASGLSHPKLIEKEIDFDSIEKFSIENFDAVFCCLGTTINKAKTQEQFYKVDHDYVVELARYAEKSGVSKFIVVSSIGAKKESSNFYLRTKGKMEFDVSRFKVPSIIFLRPSMLLGKRKEFRFGEVIGKGFMKAMGFMFIGNMKKYKGIQAKTVAEAMASLAKKNIEGKIIYESDLIAKISKEK